MKRGILATMGAPGEDGRLVAAAATAGLHEIAAPPGFRIYAGADVAVRTLPDRSVVFGDIFSRTAAACVSPSDGWGSYLAFSKRNDVWQVERAPLTGMPIYWVRTPSGILCASDYALLEGLLAAPAIDWEFVAQTLAFINLRADRTGISGLRELLPGMRLTFDGTEPTVAPAWTPWPHVASATRKGVDDLAPELERVIVDCMRHWSASRRNIVLELSGGLDSSIVAVALAAAGADFSAITFATPGADGDERHYARAVAERCGVRLSEIIHDDAGIDLISEPRMLGPRPAAYGVLGGIDIAFEEAVPRELGSVFGGIGGDNIFDFDGTVAPILDAFGQLGFRPRAFATLRDVARAGNATIWEAARLSLRAKWAGARKGWRRDVQYLNRAAMPERPFAHPWDDGAEAASSAKRNHVESIRRILDFLDRPGRWQGRDVVAPLLSQPVAELCLSIPSWTWFAGGRDRMVARTAFARHLPSEIAWRRGKGRLESLCAAAYLRQRLQLGELLLGGRLAERGLLDLTAIEAYLGQETVEGSFDYFRLIEIADVERWVRGIEARSPGLPSADQR